MEELRPDPPWWYPKYLPAGRRARRLRRLRRRKERQGRFARKATTRAFVRVLREPRSRATLVSAIIATIQVVSWASRPRSRVVFRARIDAGDHLEIRAVPRS